MITVKKIGNNINITGHANFADLGKDIVCSSVSSIVITTVNAILKIDENSIKVDEKNGISIEVLKENKITLSLLDNMLDLLKELESKYPKNIKVKEGV